MDDWQQTDQEFDLQPDPRILPMLGEINLPQWKCVAEFVDNSVDAFLAAARENQVPEEPRVDITLPTSDSPTARITALDNGPGMDAATLERAVRAGWSGNDPIGSLGLFGMGFNIATARLGTLTRVWTTRAEDAEWCGLEIDFDRLMRQKHFKTPRLARAKVDPGEHGTEITVLQLKPEQRQWFAQARNRSLVRRELGRIYSTMLGHSATPMRFALAINGDGVLPREHCVWGGPGSPDRTVQTQKYGEIHSYQVVEARMDPRLYCTRCWQWLLAGETKCPTCESDSHVLLRERTVRGWVGLQRYLSDTDFGVDFLRNGRKIELGSKELFEWSDGEVVAPEYPIDDPRHRGRLVGEIHLDHCRVTYMKDRFDRNDPAWQEMIDAVRGPGPLRPDKAAELGFPANTAPLYLLFQAFRRSQPKPVSAGCYKRLLVVKENARAVEMAQEFYKGNPEYVSDLRWWQIVEEQDRALLTDADNSDDGGSPGGFIPDPGGSSGGGGLEGGGEVGESGAGGGDGVSRPEVPGGRPVSRSPIASLTREYIHDATGLRWDVRAFEAVADDPVLSGSSAPWALVSTSLGQHEFIVDDSDGLFLSATLTPLDALLAELAWRTCDVQRGGQDSVTFGGVLSELRKRYGTPNDLDPIDLSARANGILLSVAKSVASCGSDVDCVALYDDLSPTERDEIQRRMATRAVDKPQTVIETGRFLEYASRWTLVRFFERHAGLFFDGLYWDDAYEGIPYDDERVANEARAHVRGKYISLLGDAVWLAEEDPEALRVASRVRLLRAALALDLLDQTVAQPDLE